jgi:CheY-like chemotaxis protein
MTSALKFGLEGRGFSVDAYNNPLDALSEFKPGMYDASILDIRMPQMTGFELCRRLKKIDPTLRVCFLTAFDIYQKEFDTMFPDLKADALLRKAVSLNQLVKTLRDLLAAKKRPGFVPA